MLPRHQLEPVEHFHFLAEILLIQSQERYVIVLHTVTWDKELRQQKLQEQFSGTVKALDDLSGTVKALEEEAHEF